MNCRDSPATAFWRVDNCLGTFLPAESSSLNLVCGAYDLRHIFFGASEFSEDVSSSSHGHVNSSRDQHPAHSATADSGQRFPAVASFHLVWWNQGSASRKKLSIWRPVVPQGMVYFGDIAVKGYAMLAYIILMNYYHMPHPHLLKLLFSPSF